MSLTTITWNPRHPIGVVKTTAFMVTLPNIWGVAATMGCALLRRGLISLCRMVFAPMCWRRCVRSPFPCSADPAAAPITIIGAMALARPRSAHALGMSCGLQVEDDNALGTHEFMWLCNYLGAEPYLAGNVGSGAPQELCDWMEYCNTPLNTTLGALRRT